MAGPLTAQQVTLGDSATDSQNFRLRSNADGTLTLARGANGALGSVLAFDANSNPTFGTAVAQRMVLLTAKPTTSGTSIDFLPADGVPSWAKKITVMLNEMSTNGTSPPQLQLGATTFLTSGYRGSNSITINAAVAGSTLFTSGFGLGVSTGNWAASSVVQGAIVLQLMGSNLWTCSGILGGSHSAVNYYTGGSVTLGGTLDRIRLTTVNGTDTFDAGSVNLLIEG